MEKSEISKALQRAKRDYSTAANTSCTHLNIYLTFLRDRRLNFGFCHYFNNNIIIIKELAKDGGCSEYQNPLEKLWYPVLEMRSIHTIESIIEFNIKPRLDHLNRTIARLQKELKAA